MLEDHNQRLTVALKHAKGFIGAFETREEAYAAQAIISDLTLSKMNGALHAKEVKKSTKPDKQMLPNLGYGRLWSTQAILDFQTAKKKAETDDLAEKKKRKDKRAAQKAGKEAIEKEWQEIKAKHEEEVKEWGIKCQNLREKGTKGKDLPKKPTHIIKKDLAALCQPPEPEEPEEEDGNGDGSD